MEENVERNAGKNDSLTGARSEAMTELLSSNSGFLTRWALLISLVILFLIVGSTYFIHYPETIKTRARLTAVNAPKKITILQEGRLVKLFVKNEDKVDDGQVLAYIESTAKHEQILNLSKNIEALIKQVGTPQLNEIPTNFYRDISQLGELQPAYQGFMLAFQTYADYLSKGYSGKKKGMLKDDIDYLHKNYDFLLQQKELMQKDIDLEVENFNSNDSLFNEKILSTQDYRTEKSRLINKKLNEPQMNISLLGNEIQRREKAKEIFELDHTQSQQELIFRQAILTLQSSINEWMRKYIVCAPVAGTLSFALPLQEHELLAAGFLMGYVIPGAGQYTVEMNLPQNNFGKVKPGQLVQLQFEAYPHSEYGYVPATIRYISQIPTDSGYVSYLDLPKGLVTNHNKLIGYRTGLTAEGLVILKDMRLMQRFYNNILSGMKSE